MYEQYECDELSLLAKKHRREGNGRVCNVLREKGCCEGDDDECC